MGLMSEPDGTFVVLTDILGKEDAFGDMDFKVTGTRDGISALQMDIKIQGITGAIIRTGLKDALAARLAILDALRAVVDTKALGENTIVIDCDVLQADGGTRTAAITGAFVAARDAVQRLLDQGLLKASPIRDHVAAISCGIHGGTPVLDLDYPEDSSAGTDANFVMTGSGGIVEIQGTAEGRPFSEEQLTELLRLAKGGIGADARRRLRAGT